MRNLIMPAGCLILALLMGCAAPGLNWFKPATAKGPVQPVPTKEALVRYLNENAVSDHTGKKVQTLRCDDIDVKVTLNPDSFNSQSLPNLKAKMIVQAPRNFFMRGDVGSSTYFDLGSNDQEFWWWIKDIKGGQSNQYYCSYKDLQEGRARNLNFPLQPEWIIEVLGLGLGPYGPAEKYQISNDADTVRLTEKASVQGRPVSKVIVFQRRNKALPEPIVSDFLLIDDGSGKEICSAHIAEAQLDNTATNAVLPRRIEITISGPEKVRMVLTMNRVQVNPGLQMVANGQARLIPGNPILAAAFIRRPLDNARSIDIAGSPSGVQQVQGQR